MYDVVTKRVQEQPYASRSRRMYVRDLDLGAYEAVFRWANEHDREVDGPAREIYLNGPEEDLRMDIAVP